MPQRDQLCADRALPCKGVSSRLCKALTLWLSFLVYSPILPPKTGLEAEEGGHFHRWVGQRQDTQDCLGSSNTSQEEALGWEDPEKLRQGWGLWSTQGSGREVGLALQPKENK